jgi:adenine-specific DNA-methyltransferase
LEDNADKLKERETPLDIGFRVYKTDSTNMKDVYYNPAELKQSEMDEYISNIKEDRGSEDLLTQVMLDLGLTLDLPIEKKDIKGSTVFFIAGNSLVACFDENMNIEIIDEIAKIKPLKVVFRDACFKDDKDAINMENKFKSLSPETVISVI